MNLDTFRLQGRKLAGDTRTIGHMETGFQALLASLSKQGLSLGATGAGELSPVTPDGPGFGHFRGCVVSDPLFGQYVVRLELTLTWAGASLALAAYRCLPGTADVHQLLRPPLAWEQGAVYPRAWQGEFGEARERLQVWLAGKLVDASSAMDAFCLSFRQKLDLELAP